MSLLPMSISLPLSSRSSRLNGCVTRFCNSWESMAAALTWAFISIAIMSWASGFLIGRQTRCFAVVCQMWKVHLVDLNKVGASSDGRRGNNDDENDQRSCWSSWWCALFMNIVQNVEASSYLLAPGWMRKHPVWLPNRSSSLLIELVLFNSKCFGCDDVRDPIAWANVVTFPHCFFSYRESHLPFRKQAGVQNKCQVWPPSLAKFGISY